LSMQKGDTEQCLKFRISNRTCNTRVFKKIVFFELLPKRKKRNESLLFAKKNDAVSTNFGFMVKKFSKKKQ
jgi:hypothetical protein